MSTKTKAHTAQPPAQPPAQPQHMPIMARLTLALIFTVVILALAWVPYRLLRAALGYRTVTVVNRRGRRRTPKMGLRM